MGRTAIVGWAHTPFGKLDDPDVESLMARVSGEALRHAEVDAEAVDGIYVGVMNNGFSKQGFEGAQVALNEPALAQVPATHLENACASGTTAIYAARDFIGAGRGRIALVIGVEKMTHATGAQVGDNLLGASYRKEEGEIAGGFAGVFGRIAEKLLPALRRPVAMRSRPLPRRTTRTAWTILMRRCAATSASTSAATRPRRTPTSPGR